MPAFAIGCRQIPEAFSTFFGGGDRNWATPKEQYADFVASAVTSHQIGPVHTP